MITKAKKIELVTKHSKKFASKSEGRPILQGVHYAADGSVIVTDSMQMLRVKNAHEYEQPFTSHATTGENLVDSEYPNTDRMWPKDFKHMFELRHEQIKSSLELSKIAADLAKKVDKRKPTAFLQLRDNEIRLGVKDELFRFDCHFAFYILDESFELWLNPVFIHNALSVFKAAGSTEVIVECSPGITPLVMSDETNEIDVMIAPVRINKNA